MPTLAEITTFTSVHLSDNFNGTPFVKLCFTKAPAFGRRIYLVKYLIKIFLAV